ncbi:hypothetical protein ABZP36_004391 [Zizania latifolia]
MDLQVTEFFPEDFLVTLAEAPIRDAVLEAGSMVYGGRVFVFRPWDVQLHARSASLPFHVRLCIEGLLMHAWNEEGVAHVVGRYCSVHYYEEYSRRNNYSKTYDLWAWCHNPSDTAKIVWLTVSNLDPLQPSVDIPFVCADPYDSSVEGLKLGHTYKLLIHVDKVEDYSKAAMYGHPCVRSFEWRLGVPDGEDVHVTFLDARYCSQNSL